MKIVNSQGVMTVFLTGDIDHHTARAMREKIDYLLLKSSPKELVLDFSAVSFMDSSGVGLVMGRYKCASSVNCKTAVTGLTPRDKKIMLMSGLASLAQFR